MLREVGWEKIKNGNECDVFFLSVLIVMCVFVVHEYLLRVFEVIH